MRWNLSALVFNRYRTLHTRMQSIKLKETEFKRGNEIADF
jgi:hypothetical protein